MEEQFFLGLIDYHSRGLKLLRISNYFDTGFRIVTKIMTLRYQIIENLQENP